MLDFSSLIIKNDTLLSVIKIHKLRASVSVNAEIPGLALFSDTSFRSMLGIPCQGTACQPGLLIHISSFIFKFH